MINANELRIGNWWSNGEKYYTADACMIYDLATVENYPCYPIPLTPEILENAGFERKKDSEGEDYLSLKIYNGIDGSDIRFYGSELNVVSLFCGNKMVGHNQYHLHQLQNLYFALTGEELIINL